MKRLRAGMMRLSGMLFKQRREQEIADEMESHLQLHIEDNLRAGMTPEEARREALLKLGGLEQTKQSYRERGTVPALEALGHDVRFAFRQLRKKPGFAFTAVLVLALGIGASTAIFSAVNPILFQPLPYPDPSRVMMLWEEQSDGSREAVCFGTFHGLQERNRSFDAVAAMKPWQPTMIGRGEPERFDGQRVSADYFRVLGVEPVLGRGFDAADDQHNGPNVVVLSDGLWRRRFAGDRAILGRQITLDDNLYTVIGVMPKSFENAVAPTTQLWAPLQYDPSLPADGREWGHHLQMIGRLAPGVGRSDARNELGVILHTLGQIYAKGFNSSGGVPKGMLVNPLQADITRDVRPALLAILGAVVLVLLIACVNVTNLMLARGAQRRGEFAMRAALGANRMRLVQQLLTESLLLAGIGGLIGILLANGGVRLLVALSPADLPRVGAIGVDNTVLLFALGITTLVGLVVGLMPALHASHSDPHAGLQQNTRTTVGGHQMTRRALVVSEVAIALVLLVSAGLLLRSIQRLFAIPPGFDSSHLLTMQVQEYGHRFDKDADRARFYEQALLAVRQVPGVVDAAFTSQLPLSGDFDSYGVEFEAHPGDLSSEGFRYAVDPSYFDVMKIPLLRGRLLNERDRAGAPVAVLLSDSYAKRMFAGRDPIGQRVRIGPDYGHPDKPWATVVGVVGDVKQLSLGLSDAEAFYTTPTQWYWVDDVQSLVVRTRGDAAVMAPAIRRAIWSVDKDQPVVRVATMENLVAASEAQRHFALVLFEAFALVGLILAATGIYGVLSGNVAERTREIGVRAALGASPANILRLILRQGMTLTGLGVAIGLLGAVAASRALLTLLFGVSPLDPLTYAGVVAVLAAVAAIACWIPARRAAQVDPAITLRAE
ncbi:MAG: ABC transporter permease [Candidatus Korobacteraceae bacterium]